MCFVYSNTYVNKGMTDTELTQYDSNHIRPKGSQLRVLTEVAEKETN